jgi:hypothetical protein
MYALCVIAWRLNGNKVPGKRARGHLVERVNALRQKNENETFLARTDSPAE